MKNQKGFVVPLVITIIAVLVIGGSVYVYNNKNIYYISRESDVKNVVDIAIKNNNPLLCGKIIGTGFSVSTQSLRDVCYSDVAQSLNDTNICEYMFSPVYKPGCIQGLAVKRNDISVCNKINDQTDRGACYSKFTSQGYAKSACESINDPTGKDMCYMGTLAYSHNISICETNIQTQHYKDQCYKSIAFDTKNNLTCKKIVDQTEEKDCERYINATVR